MNGSRRESKATILVVDDDQDIRFIVARTLEKMGYKVLAVETGAEGVQAVESQKVDLALVDVKMPGMAGRETIREIRKLNPQLPIILLTGSPDWPDRELRATTQGCIYKPFRLEQLRTTVRKTLEEASKADTDSGTE